MRESATKNRVAFSPKKRESLLVERVESNLVDRVGKWIALLITFAIPIEHKYDKFLRFFSIKIIPSTLFLPPGYDPKIYIYASDILSLILFGLLLYTFKSSLRRILFENGSLFLWTLFFSALCSLIFSPFSTYLTAYTRLLQLFTPIAIYCFISSRLMDVRPFFYALLIAGCVQSCIAIAQYFAQDSLGLRLLSESRDPPSAFIMENAKLTLFGPSMATDSKWNPSS